MQVTITAPVERTVTINTAETDARDLRDSLMKYRSSIYACSYYRGERVLYQLVNKLDEILGK